MNWERDPIASQLRVPQPNSHLAKCDFKISLNDACSQGGGAAVLQPARWRGHSKSIGPPTNFSASPVLTPFAMHASFITGKVFWLTRELAFLCSHKKSAPSSRQIPMPFFQQTGIKLDTYASSFFLLSTLVIESLF